MKTILALIACALAANAAAQDRPASNAQTARPALNLRLDDGTNAAPRINFDQPASAQTKAEREKGLPELGGKPSEAYERPVTSGSSSGAVIPNAMDPLTNSTSSSYGR